jgi:lysosomal alpha-mannosidase
MKDHYKTNHLFITMGDDFRYQNAKKYFGSIDKLINYFNINSLNVTLMYSTPSNYIDEINN